MEGQNGTDEPLLEPAEGREPEQEDEYERAEKELSRQPLEEPAEGAPEDTPS